MDFVDEAAFQEVRHGAFLTVIEYQVLSRPMLFFLVFCYAAKPVAVEGRGDQEDRLRHGVAEARLLPVKDGSVVAKLHVDAVFQLEILLCSVKSINIAPSDASKSDRAWQVSDMEIESHAVVMPSSVFAQVTAEVIIGRFIYCVDKPIRRLGPCWLYHRAVVFFLHYKILKYFVNDSQLRYAIESFYSKIVFMQNRVYIGDLKDHIDSEVTIQGWIQIRRDQGKMIFFDFRDMSGVVQGVVLPGSAAMDTAKEVRSEWVVSVSGKVNKRPERAVKAGVVNGELELEVLNIKVLNKAETPVFDILSDTREINEETRLTNRYIDIRSERLQRNIRMRHKVQSFVRTLLDKQKFTEVETPIFTKSTPEGARDYVVPSRLFPGNFYALPQSPQQYKQLLMAGGIERYYQFARCMRDEDLRGDRQPEFTQLDMEMSFVEESDVMAITENLLIEIVKNLYPEKKIQAIPFPHITYKDAMEKYGNDRPDIRENKEDPNLLAFCWVVDFPFFEKTAKSDNPQAQGEWTFTHNPFSICKPEHLANVMEKKDIGDVLAAQYDIVLNGYEIGGGSIRSHDPEVLKNILGILGYTPEKIDTDYGHMLRALASGTPPHGGIAWGFDRLMMILQGEPNIREVIAFPKTREGRDPMMQSPSPISDKQLTELSIKVTKKE